MKNIFRTMLEAAMAVLMLSGTSSCEWLDHPYGKIVNDDGDVVDTTEVKAAVELSSLARVMSTLPLGKSQMTEVFDAVNNSSRNGYDEEYMMRNLFMSPGSGVGDDLTKADDSIYTEPLRDMLASALAATRADSGSEFDDAAMLSVDGLVSSDVQIYWPYSELWDGESLPIITHNPGGDAVVSDGYMLVRGADGSLSSVPVTVDEAMALTHPVWVINRNDDSSFTTLEQLRRQEGDYSGSSIVVSKASSAAGVADSPYLNGGNDLPRMGNGKASPDGVAHEIRTLVLKDFTMKRHYDSWLRGASEFFVKLGSLENFTASTEAELCLYNPKITDFMIVVKRKDVGKKLPFNAILVAEWTKDLASCAFMITEDDGGSVTSWNTTAVVKVNSKSYGVELAIPYKSKDDIVWRGNLSYGYITAHNNIVGNFGDVQLTFHVDTATYYD